MKRLTTAALASLLAAGACVPDSPPIEDPTVVPGLDPDREETSHKLAARISSLAGADGRITTLARYDDGGVHPGVNAVDIGAPGGSNVWHQLDYLPPGVAGGWVRAEVVKEAGRCSQWWPDSPYYNGAKILVYTYFYGIDGAYLGWHRAAYQHVVPHADHMNAWWTFNNASAEVQGWPGPNAVYNNGKDGGLFLGHVFAPRGWIYNGPGGGLCTTGPHLHQEGDGARTSRRFVGERLTARYNDVHDFELAPGLPAPGAPPSGLPISDPPVTVPIPEETPPDPCTDLGYRGRCDAGVLVWCEAGSIKSYDCAAKGLGCGFQNENVGFNCVRGCGELDYAGGCAGASLRWCEGASVRRYECGRVNKTCAWQSDAVGYNCL